jgi:hypothetical protein
MPGCGGGGSSGKPIPQSQANQMLSLLQLADADISNGACKSADAKAVRAEAIAARLPSSVDPSVRQGLTDGLTRLRSLIQTQCQPPQATPTTTTTQSQTTTTPTTTTPTTTTTTPTTTDTTPTTTDTTTTPTTTDTTTTPTPTGTGNGGVPPTPTGAAVAPGTGQ